MLCPWALRLGENAAGDRLRLSPKGEGETRLAQRCPRRHGPLGHLPRGRLARASFHPHAGAFYFQDTP